MFSFAGIQNAGAGNRITYQFFIPALHSIILLPGIPLRRVFMFITLDPGVSPRAKIYRPFRVENFHFLWNNLMFT